nr:hypothetical protein DWF04_06055 [Cereibacter sphaeroides f. sp. denitrificans]
MKITLEGFAGEIPKTQPRYLPQTHAASVSGARLNRGDLAPMRSPVLIDTLAAEASRIYLHGSTWISWTGDGDAAPGPVAQDRLYISHGAGAAPQLLYSGVYYGLALNPPNEKPAVARTGTLDPELTETVRYAYTWVTSLGEESAPSTISDAINWSPGCTITVSMVATPGASRLVTKKRVYRSVTSTTGVTDLYFVKELAAGVTSYVHDIAADPPQEVLPSLDYDTPPANLTGLTALPNGIMAGFSGRDLFFCEPWQPHAWPRKYALATNDPIVGLCAFGTSLAVLTTGTPYVVQGLHPDSMSMERLEQSFPCLSRRGIVDMGYAAIFPSTNGLVEISQSGARLISSALWDRDQWGALWPAGFRAAQFQGRYAFSYAPGGVGARKLAMVDLSGEMPFLLPAPGSYRDLYHHLATGRLIGLANDGISVYSLDDSSGSLASFTWRSKPFAMPVPTGFGVIMVDAQPPTGGETPSLTAKVYRDGTLIRTITAANVIERLPEGLGSVWQVEVSGNWTVTRIVLAGTPDEVWQ